jgi:plastocyanin
MTAHHLPVRVLVTLLLCAGLTCAQQTTVTASVAVGNGGKKSRPRDAGNVVVVWLAPSEGTVIPQMAAAQSSPHPRLVQRNKSFEPHVLVVRVGSMVEFPNRDPFFHNVFSLFEGKRFDLGLYEAGSTRDVLFDKPGISYIFCNIHTEMSAVVVAVNTPYYAISDRRGQIVIPDVALGRYMLRVWYEGALPATMNALTREVTISESTSTLGLLRLPAATLPPEHKNMYGSDYPPPAPGSPAYEHP